MKRENCLNEKTNREDCPCKNISCQRHGVCCLCIRHHKKSDDYPACLEKII